MRLVTPLSRPRPVPHVRDVPATAPSDPPRAPALRAATAPPGPLPLCRLVHGSRGGRSPRPLRAGSDTQATVIPSRRARAPPTATRPSAAPTPRAPPLDSTRPGAGAVPSHARSPGAKAPDAVPAPPRTETRAPPRPGSASTRSRRRARPDDRERPEHRPPPIRQDDGGRETPRTASPTPRTTPPYGDCNGARAPPSAHGQAACAEASLSWRSRAQL